MTSQIWNIVFIFLPLLLPEISKTANIPEKSRDGKFFNIFSIVQFKNNGCTSTMTLASGNGNLFRNGTCFTSAECNEKGGASSGSCAGGFGVCCVFMTSTCGATVSQNCSYIKNPNFPAAYTATAACSYTIQKCDSCKRRYL